MFGRRWFTLWVFVFYIEKRQCSYHALYSKPPTLTYMDQSFGSYNFFSVPFFPIYLLIIQTQWWTCQYNQSSTLEKYAISWGWLQRLIEEINGSDLFFLQQSRHLNRCVFFQGDNGMGGGHRSSLSFVWACSASINIS